MLAKDQKGINLFQIVQFVNYIMIVDLNSNSTITVSKEPFIYNGDIAEGISDSLTLVYNDLLVRSPLTVFDTSTGILIDGFNAANNTSKKTIVTNKNFLVINVHL